MKLSLMFKHWVQVRSDLMSTIDRFNPDELTFAPFKGSWPVGQIMLHIADCEDNWLYGVVQGELEPWVFSKLEEYPAIPIIKEALERAHNRTTSFLLNLEEDDLAKEYKTTSGEEYSLGWIIWHVLEHEIHHRGELSLCLGMLGREGLDV